MSGSFRDFIKIAVVVIITLGLAGLCFLGYSKSEGFANKAFSKIDNMSNMVEESDYTKYDGAIISGTEVIAAIKYFSVDGAICIQVNSQTYVCEEDLTPIDTAEESRRLADAQRRGTATYINPSTKFLGSLERDAQGMVTKIMFSPASSTTTP